MGVFSARNDARELFRKFKGLVVLFRVRLLQYKNSGLYIPKLLIVILSHYRK